VNHFVVVRFSDPAKADRAVVALTKLRAERGAKLHASAVVTKDAAGRASVREITKEGHGGTAAGALIGALAGLPAGPAAIAIMATGGAVIGNAADLTDQQDFAELAEGFADDVPPGGAVIVADLDEEGVAAFEAEMQALGGTVLLAR